MPLLHAPICPRYSKLPGEKTCQHYAGKGACALPEALICVEWLRMNPGLAAPGSPSVEQLIAQMSSPPPPSGTSANAPLPAVPPAVVAAALPSVQRLDLRPLAPLLSSAPTAQQPLPRNRVGKSLVEDDAALGPQSTAALAARGFSFDLECPAGPVRLVPAYSDPAPTDVFELTFEDARVLYLLLSAIPEARIAQIRRKP